MSELMLSQIQHMLNRVSDEVDRLGNNSQDNTEQVLGAMDDLAANVFAAQVVIRALMKQYPLELDAAMAELDAQTGQSGIEAPTTRLLVKYLVTGDKS
ncbi:hypothetical protein [Roseospirillum parvum]|uniref:Uncharacterized protein n=1 Tax=Roseospirillum parvum TaxID=83401 RepID=A0A1G8BMK6_9PROT|nr:hypothetical protein [Roseospirillum parvum]SDH34449.1 hypothetical protein SAMN05421742_10675 [Roseospirillum parvum]